MTLLVYVDDIVLTRNNHKLCADFKAYLDKCFHIRDLSNLKYFLGIEVVRNYQGLFFVPKKVCLRNHQ